MANKKKEAEEDKKQLEKMKKLEGDLTKSGTELKQVKANLTKA